MKTRLGIDGSSDDAYLQQQLDMASLLIRNYCARPFESTAYTENYRLDTSWHDWFIELYRPNYLDGQMQLKHSPVISLDSITVAGTALTVDTEYWVESLALGRIRIQSLEIYNNDDGAIDSELVIAYTADYATVPADVQEVCMDIVTSRYMTKGYNPMGGAIRSESIPDSVRIAYDTTDMISGVMDPAALSKRFGGVLDAYIQPQSIIV
jgi:hypothetical protein